MRAGLCEACRAKRAEFLVGKVSGERRHDERLLCAECAGDRERVLCGDSGVSLVGLLDIRIRRLSEGERNRTKVCPGCGNTRDEAEQSGMLGCPMCYVIFREEIAPVIEELHGYSPGRGKPA